MYSKYYDEINAMVNEALRGSKTIIVSSGRECITEFRFMPSSQYCFNMFSEIEDNEPLAEMFDCEVVEYLCELKDSCDRGLLAGAYIEII